MDTTTLAAFQELERYTKGDKRPTCPSCGQDLDRTIPALQIHAERCRWLRKDVKKGA